jgi:hypothetical protein
MTVINLYRTSGTTWTVPANCTSAQVEVYGMGGNGTSFGSVNGTPGYGGAGGGGGYAIANSVPFTPGAVITICFPPNYGGAAIWINSSTYLYANQGGNATSTSSGAGGTAGDRRDIHPDRRKCGHLDKLQFGDSCWWCLQRSVGE